MVPEVWAVQVTPSLLECRIVPLAPTAKTSVELLSQTPLSRCVVPEFWAVQLLVLLV